MELIIALFSLTQLHISEPTRQDGLPAFVLRRQQVTPLADIPNRIGDTVRIAGRVTLGTGVFGPRQFRVYVQDVTGGARLSSDALSLHLEAGDSLEAWGVAAASHSSHAIVRVLRLRKTEGLKRFPSALSVPLSNAALEQHRGRLISVTGRVVSATREKGDDILIVADFADTTARVIVEAEEDLTQFAGFARFGRGDAVSATGVLARRTDSRYGPGGYVLYARGRSDVASVGVSLRTRRMLSLGVAVFMLVVVAAFGVARIITQRAQRRLAQAQAQLHATYEVASDAILVLDSRWRIIGANAAASAVVGCERRALLGRAALPLLYPDSIADRAATESGLAAAASTDQRARFVGSNGKPVTVDLRLIRIEVFGQHRIVAVLRDVSEKLRAEAELRGIFAAMTDVVLVLGRDGEYLRIPSTNTNRLYRPASELLGRNVRDVLPAEQSKNICRVIQNALDSRQPVAYDYSLSFPEGDVWFSASVTPLDENAVVWVARDVTSERNAAEALRESEERFRQAQKVVAVGMLAGGIAHDFNNILTAIRAHSEFLLEGLASGIPVHADAREILKATDRAAALTHQLLAFSRKQAVRPAEVDLNAVVTNVLAMLTRLIGEDIDVVTTLDPTVSLVVADTTQLEQVILNLAVNARDAMPDGGALRIATSNVEVRDRLARNGMLPGSYVRMAVTDSGCGMSEETQARVFQPFFTTKAEGFGTGLGLATVAGIVRQANGFISVTSEPRRGTTFEVFLPCITASAHGEMTHEDDTRCDTMLRDATVNMMDSANPRAEAVVINDRRSECDLNPAVTAIVSLHPTLLAPCVPATH